MMILLFFWLIVSPWFVQLFISPIETNFLIQPIASVAEFWRNLAFYTSPEFIFFSGDRRLAYGTQEFGLMYLSWLPLVLMGLNRYLSVWLGLGILVSSLFKVTAPFSAALLYLPALQIAVTLGARRLVHSFRRQHWLIRIGIIVLALFNVYEIANFFHVLTLHYPQRIHEVI